MTMMMIMCMMNKSKQNSHTVFNALTAPITERKFSVNSITI